MDIPVTGNLEADLRLCVRHLRKGLHELLQTETEFSDEIAQLLNETTVVALASGCYDEAADSTKATNTPKQSKYEQLDARILQAIELGHSPLYWRFVNQEAVPIATAEGRETFRVIDGRVQALRKAGKIVYLKKKDNKGAAGWRLA